MTPQEQHPLFFKKPHLWINAIEVECVGSYADLPVPKDSGYKAAGNMAIDAKSRTYPFTVEHLAWLREIKALDYYAPKFKPQEGEQFIKDLETAVSAGFGGAKATYYKTPSSIVFEVENGEIEIWGNLKVTTSSGIAFDTAAYVDKMRELGYYI